MSMGSEELVDELAQRLKDDGYPVLDGLVQQGDGYYESVVLDPDGIGSKSPRYDAPEDVGPNAWRGNE